MAEKTQGSDLSFEERINEVLDKRLRDQTTLPAEFRSWLPRFIEIQNIQLPISQVTGANLTGTTVDSLGGDVHGRVGMIRAGATPYDFVQVTFDAVYDKWVSSPVVVMGQVSTFSTTSTTYTELDTTEDFVFPYESFATAGLKPQLRLLGQLDNSAASTATATILMGTFNAGEAITAATEPSWNITLTGTSESFKDAGWNDIPSMTVKSFLAGAAVLKSSSGANTASVTVLTLLMRWVSA